MICLAAKVSAIVRSTRGRTRGRPVGCDVGTATSAVATVTVEAYQEEGGEKNRSKRKEKRSRRKERDLPRTSVCGASRGARTDAARVGDCVALGRTRGRLAAVPHGDDGAGLRVAESSAPAPEILD